MHQKKAILSPVLVDFVYNDRKTDKEGNTAMVNMYIQKEESSK